MFLLDPAIVQARLKATVPQFVSVGLAADLGGVSARSLRYPSAFVVLLGEDATDTTYIADDLIEQNVTARVGVILAIRDIADRTGAAATTALTPIRAAVLRSLGTFIAEPGLTAFRFARGALQSGIDAQGGLFWQDTYNLRHPRRIKLGD